MTNHENATKLRWGLLFPPDGYHLIKIDVLTGNANLMFKLYGKRQEDWHLHGEVLNIEGDDIREPLYLTRIIKDFPNLLNDLLARDMLFEEMVGVLKECSQDLAEELMARYGYPKVHPRLVGDYVRDMSTVDKAQSILTRVKETK